MNILYYFEPWIELSRPHLRYHNLRYQLGPQIRSIKKNLHDVDIKIALGEGTLHKCSLDRYDLEGCEYVVLEQSELKTFSENYLSASITLFNEELEPSQAYAEYLRDKLNGWTPDIVISFLSPLPNLKRIWPSSNVFYAEFGIFSRAPYPRTFYFDPEGMFCNSSLRRYSSNLLSENANEIDIKLLNNFRIDYLQAFYQQRSILDADLLRAASLYECKLLLPLQFSSYFGFDCCAQYADQFEYLTDVLDSIPGNIGVFVTEHTGWQEVITEHNISFLKDRYPNLLWSPHLSKIRAASQYLLAEVDGVVTVSSSVGLQCMVWDKPLYSPWNSHLKGFSETETLAAISIENIRGYKKGRYDNAVIELLSR